MKRMRRMANGKHECPRCGNPMTKVKGGWVCYCCGFNYPD
jgi:ribosomal protein L37AE/L43A